jgi:preprotein translocase SecE subunit
VGNRALRRQQARAKEGKAGRSGAQRALPSTGPRPQARPAAGGRGGLLSWRPRFIVDIISELRKVAWPERDDVVHLTVVVVIVTLILGAVLGAIDIGFGWVIDKALLN